MPIATGSGTSKPKKKPKKVTEAPPATDTNVGGNTFTPKSSKPTKIPPVKVYVKKKNRKAVQAHQAVRFINEQTGRKTVKLTAKKKKAQIQIRRGPNDGGGGYTYGQPKNAKEVLKGKPTRIRINTRAGADSAGFEGAPKKRSRTSQRQFRRTGLLGSNLKERKNFRPTVAQTTAHEITHALGVTHRAGYEVVNGKYRKKDKQPGDHIMDWSSSEYSESEVRAINRKTNPKNIGKPGNPKKKGRSSRQSRY